MFALDTVAGQECYVLPMAIASGTFIRSENIFVRLDDPPTGAFLIDSNGVKNTDASSRVLALHEAKKTTIYTIPITVRLEGRRSNFAFPKRR